MTPKKFLYFIFVLLFLFLIKISFVSAVGIGGDIKSLVYFEPGLERHFHYIVHSNTDKIMDHSISVGGPLAQYFTLSTNVIKDMYPDSYASFDMTLKFPENLELEPGFYRQYICVAETQTRGAGAEEGSIGIGTRVVMCAKVDVLSLWYDKYVSFEFHAPNVKVGDLATFVLDVRSLSKQDMLIKGAVDIYEKEFEYKVTTLYTGQKLLESGSEEELKTTLDTTGFEVGEYRANATLFFNGNQTSKEKTFRMGDISMQILNYTEEAIKGKLNPINVDVQSNWNSEIEDVWFLINVNDQTNKKNLASIKSPSTTFEAWERKNITAYWDANVSGGEYDIKIILNYEDKKTTRDGKIKIKHRLEMPELTATNILLLLLIILVTVLIIIVLITMKKKRKEIKKEKIKKRRRIRKSKAS